MAKRSPKSKAATPTAKTPIMVVYGAEAARQKQLVDKLKEAAVEAHGDVEIFNFDGKSASLADVFDELRSFSLMQTHKIVIVDEGDVFTKANRAPLERYAEAPVEHAVLVLRSTSWNKGKLDKLIEGSGGIIAKCDTLKPHEAEQWIVERATTVHRCKLVRPASQVLVERAGSDLGQLDSQVAKLAVMAGIDGQITVDMIEQTVGKGSDAQAWIVQEAVLRSMSQRRPEQALGAVRELVELSGQPDILVMYFVADLMRKLAIAQTMLKAGEREQEVAAATKMNFGERKRLFFDALRKIPPGKAHALFEAAVNADKRSKSGFGTPQKNVERLLVAAIR